MTGCSPCLALKSSDFPETKKKTFVTNRMMRALKYLHLNELRDRWKEVKRNSIAPIFQKVKTGGVVSKKHNAGF
jgi:hypothetical protein